MIKLKTANEVAKHFRVTSRTVTRVARDHKIGTKLANAWLFEPSDIDRLRVAIRGKVGNPNFVKKQLTGKRK